MEKLQDKLLPKPKKDYKLSTSLLCPSLYFQAYLFTLPRFSSFRKAHSAFFNKVSPHRHTPTWFSSFQLYHYCAFHTRIFFITDGFNQNRPPSCTILATLDLSKAFDMVCLCTLVELIHDTPLPRGIVRWLSNYLNSQQATTLFNTQESPPQTSSLWSSPGLCSFAHIF